MYLENPPPKILYIDLSILWKFAVILFSIFNSAIIGAIFRFLHKNYKKYKNAIMMYVEEHETLVNDYMDRHPEQFQTPRRRSSENHVFSRIRKRTPFTIRNRNREPFKRFTEAAESTTESNDFDIDSENNNQ